MEEEEDEDLEDLAGPPFSDADVATAAASVSFWRLLDERLIVVVVAVDAAAADATEAAALEDDAAASKLGGDASSRRELRCISFGKAGS